ncbi:hypothetical protein Ppa06_47570 [Planomonospora parontospora subsp. parontospora]|uniref:Uncharacterized protein n=2 Tax=Planomonospora parontospora TaxID=58119 RepID=A0AA37BJT8_9ACTN|nr:hypothetical protein [Planomonospora parontospora]GGK82316.1 hypothetical protein GCM10010126_47040 [Planomonospora parontospora]GII10959.1 hypothetical protein Ppa06_47570 [Planomonospora parontospora subsp. parontospora]
MDELGLKQLVYLVTDWREWRVVPEDQEGGAAGSMVGRMLDPGAGVPGSTWLATSEGDALGTVDWLRGGEAADALAAYRAKINALARGGPRAEHPHDGDSRLYVLLDPERADALLRPDPRETAEAPPEPDRDPVRPRSFWVLLDVRFLYSGNRPMIHLSFSFWAVEPPWRPTRTGGPAVRRNGGLFLGRGGVSVPGRDLAEVRRLLQSRAPVVRALIDRHFRSVGARAWNREYGAPEFWVATPAASHKQNAAGFWAQPNLMTGLAGVFLGCGPKDNVVAAGVLRGKVLAEEERRSEALTLRRFQRELARPVYLLLAGPDSVGRAREAALRHVIAALIEVEAMAADGTHRIGTRLEIWRRHVEVYDHAVRSAGMLWDGVALHLPVRTGRSLQRAHHAVELIHQTLLQGMADLATLVGHVDEQAGKAEALPHALVDRVEERFTEEPLPAGRAGVCAALTTSHHIQRLRRTAPAVAADAKRVTEQYKDLLQSMAHAFDERRVRELEVLQRAEWTLSWAVAGFAVFAFLDFVAELDKVRGEWIWWVSGAIAAVMAAVMVRIVASSRRLRRIGSARYRGLHDSLVSFLRESSSLELGRFATENAAGDDGGAWEERDRRLAERFAELWDGSADGSRRDGDARGSGTGGVRRRWRPGKPHEADLEVLTGEIEQWIPHILLLTERARMLQSYRLPRLTLLYRYCVRLPSRWPMQDLVPVPDIEFRLVMENAGYRPGDADRIDRAVAERVGGVGERRAARHAGALLRGVEAELACLPPAQNGSSASYESTL